MDKKHIKSTNNEQNTLSTTKVKLSYNELDKIIIALEDLLKHDYTNCSIEDTGSYEDYKVDQQFINRLKRAFQRVGGEVEIKPILKIKSWVDEFNK